MAPKVDDGAEKAPKPPKAEKPAPPPKGEKPHADGNERKGSESSGREGRRGQR